jgi:hypothetical protein
MDEGCFDDTNANSMFFTSSCQINVQSHTACLGTLLSFSSSLDLEHSFMLSARDITTRVRNRSNILPKSFHLHTRTLESKKGVEIQPAHGEIIIYAVGSFSRPRDLMLCYMCW